MRPFRAAGWAGFLTLVVWTSPAAGRHRGRAVARLWAWELWRRVVRRPVDVELAAGGRLRLPCWSALAAPTVATGLHEPSEQLFVSSFLRPGDGVVDVGANIGAYTVLCAALGARVVALEPSSRTRAALADNIRVNDLGRRVRTYGLAAGGASGTAALTTGLDAANHLLDPADGGTASEMVEVRPLDALRAEIEEWLGGAPVALLKVDVEGHDLEVLQGARAVIGAHRPVILVEIWAGGLDVRAWLAGEGYRVHRFDLEGNALSEYPYDWSGQCNFIAVPDERIDEVRHRLDAAPAHPDAPHRVRWRTPPPDAASRRADVRPV